MLGFGMIPSSGLKLKDEFEMFNIEEKLPLNISLSEDNEFCICGDILRGLKNPNDCSLFADICFPENPLGACMVSNEGTCSTWYKYRHIE
jgi:hydrogenase expression/formation protein HypD